MSSASDTSAPPIHHLIVGIDYGTTFTGVSWAVDRISTPTANDGAESRNPSRSNVSLIRQCNKITDYQFAFLGDHFSYCKPLSLNPHIVARKSANQLSSSIQFRKEVHSMQNIGNNQRHDLARTDTLRGIGAVPDAMKEAEDAESDLLFNEDFGSIEPGEHPKPGAQEKLLRVPGLGGNIQRHWPMEFCTRRTHLNRKTENQPCIEWLRDALEDADDANLVEFLGNKEISSNKQNFALDRQLRSNQTQLIALGGLIGTGLFLSPTTTSGPLPLLAAFTLIAFVVWSLMLCLGELAETYFPPDRENPWIENLHQKLPQFMALLGAAYSIPQIRRVVAGIRFRPDEVLGYVFALSRIAYGVRLYSKAILRAISSNISRIWLVIQAFMESCINRLPGHRSPRSRSHARQALIMSLLLWTSPTAATATSLDTNTYSSQWSFLALLSIGSRNLTSLFTTPTPPFPRTFPPATLLLATLLATSLTTVLYTLLRHNRTMKPLLCTSVPLALLLGSTTAVDVPDLVFRYLFPGVNFAFLVSGIERGVQQYRSRYTKKINRGTFMADVEAGDKKVGFGGEGVGEKERLCGN